MRNVFISYSHKNSELASKLASRLKQDGLIVWFDERISPAEKDYVTRISTEIEKSDWVVVLWSKESAHSKWVLGEATRVQDSKRLIHVRIDDCVIPPPFNVGQATSLLHWEGDVRSRDYAKIRNWVLKDPDNEFSLRDDSEIQFLEEFLRQGMRIDLIDYIATGDVSRVYLAGDNLRRYAVKIIQDPHHDQAEINEEIRLTAQLSNPCFMRIIDVEFKGRDCIVASEYAAAKNFGTILRERQKAGKGPLPPAEILDAMRQISGALAEAHAKKLRFTRVSPSDVYRLDGDVLHQNRMMLAPLNFAYRAELKSDGENTRFTSERGPFTAPEIFALDGSPLKQPDCLNVLQRADQFSLGMLAWTMLDGRCPFETTAQKARKKVEEFLEKSEHFSDVVMKSAWCGEARALARIVSRLLKRNPAERWASMEDVNRLFTALDANNDGEQVRNLVKDLYTKYCIQPDGEPNRGFFKMFYDDFLRADELARQAFEGRFDPEQQYSMLNAALVQLLNYNEAQQEPTPLSRLKVKHASMNLKDESYKNFGASLIGTFRKFMEADTQCIDGMGLDKNFAALEIVITPAMDYFCDNST